MHGKGLTVVIRDSTALCSVHVGRRHKLDVAQFQNSRYNSEDFVDLLRGEAQVLHGFLQNTKAKTVVGVCSLATTVCFRYHRICTRIKAIIRPTM